MSCPARFGILLFFGIYVPIIMFRGIVNTYKRIVNYKNTRIVKRIDIYFFIFTVILLILNVVFVTQYHAVCKKIESAIYDA